MGIHGPTDEAPRFDVIEDANLLTSDAALGWCDEVDPLNADQVGIADRGRSTAFTSVRWGGGHPSQATEPCPVACDDALRD